MRDFSNDTSALSLNTATLGHNVDGCGAGWESAQIVDACAERGFGGITYWRREIGPDAVRIGRITREAGLAVTGLCRTPFLVGPLAPPTPAKVRDEVEASIQMAADLEAEVLTIVVGGVAAGSHSMRDSLAQVTDHVAWAAPLAGTAGVKLAIEPLNPVYGGNRSCLMSVRDAVDMCDAIDHPAVGLAIDVYHVWWDLSLGSELKRAGKERILGYHLCDWLADTQDVLLDRGMMGDGVADLKHLRAQVEEAGYRGYCEVEIFSSKNWWTRPPGEVLDAVVERFRTLC